MQQSHMISLQAVKRSVHTRDRIEGNYPHTVLFESLVPSHVPLLCPDSPLPRQLSSSSCMTRDPLPVSLLLVEIRGLFVHACWTLCLLRCGQWFGLWNNTQAREEDLDPQVGNLLASSLDFGHGDKIFLVASTDRALRAPDSGERSLSQHSLTPYT